MESITHREFRTWQAWRKEQLNNPDRHDYYLMQIACYVKHVMSKKSWDVKDMSIDFKTGKPSVAEKKLKIDKAKKRWGVKPERTE